MPDSALYPANASFLGVSDTDNLYVYVTLSLDRTRSEGTWTLHIQRPTEDDPKKSIGPMLGTPPSVAAFSPDNQALLLAAPDGSLQYLDLKKDKLVPLPTRHPSKVRLVRASWSGNKVSLIDSAFTGGTVWHIDVDSLEVTEGMSFPVEAASNEDAVNLVLLKALGERHTLNAETILGVVRAPGKVDPQLEKQEFLAAINPQTGYAKELHTNGNIYHVSHDKQYVYVLHPGQHGGRYSTATFRVEAVKEGKIQEPFVLSVRDQRTAERFAERNGVVYPVHYPRVNPLTNVTLGPDPTAWKGTVRVTRGQDGRLICTPQIDRGRFSNGDIVAGDGFWGVLASEPE